MGERGGEGETKQSDLNPNTPCERRGDEGRQSKMISTQYPDMPWETRGDKAKPSQPSIQTCHGRQGERKKTRHGRQGETKERQSKVIPAQHPDTPMETRGDKAMSSQPSIQSCHGSKGKQRETKQNPLRPAFTHAIENTGRQGETKQNHLSRVCRHAMGDRGGQRETKQNHLSPASRHATGDKARQREPKGDKAKSSQPSVQTCHGRQGWDEGRQSNIIWAPNGREGENNGKQSQIISAQHPGTPWETRGEKERESSWPSIISMQELRTRHSKAAWGKT